MLFIVFCVPVLRKGTCTLCSGSYWPGMAMNEKKIMTTVEQSKFYDENKCREE